MISNLIKADLYRIIRGKAIYVFLIILFVIRLASMFTMSPVSYVSVGSADEDYAKTQEMLFEKDIYTLSETKALLSDADWFKTDITAYAGGIEVYYFMVFMVSATLAGDMSQKTIKNTLRCGISRRTYFISKVAVNLILCVAYLLVDMIFVTILNPVMNGSVHTAGIGRMIAAFIRSIPAGFVLVGLVVFLSVILKKRSRLLAVALPLLVVYDIALVVTAIMTQGGVPDLIFEYNLSYLRTHIVCCHEVSYLISASVFCFVVFGVLTFGSFKIFERQEAG